MTDVMYGFNLQSFGCQTHLETFNSAFPSLSLTLYKVSTLKHFLNLQPKLMIFNSKWSVENKNIVDNGKIRLKYF